MKERYFKLGRYKLYIDFYRKNIDYNKKSSVFILKFINQGSKKLGSEAKVLNLGIQVLHYNKRVRVYYIKRTQTLRRIE